MSLQIFFFNQPIFGKDGVSVDKEHLICINDESEKKIWKSKKKKQNMQKEKNRKALERHNF